MNNSALYPTKLVFIASAAVIVAVLVGGCTPDLVIEPGQCDDRVPSAEREAGFVALFDGETLNGWRGYQKEVAGSGWAVENGCLARVGMGGDIISDSQYGDFELRLDWRISEAGNSGIFIRGDESRSSIHQTGYEMQVLDNVGHSDNENPTHRAGAYYDMVAPDHDTTQPVGYWNSVVITASGPEVEFCLNGRVTARFAQGSPEWQVMYANSKFTSRPAYGTLLKGHIGFQDHWDKVWFRNIRIREGVTDMAARRCGEPVVAASP